LSIQQVLKSKDTRPEGLDNAEAKKRLLRYGKNIIKDSSKSTVLSLLLGQIASPLVYVLFFAAFLAYILGDIFDAITISVIIVLNTLIGFVQEYRAEQATQVLKKILQTDARVIRQGATTNIPAEDLVSGDILVLRAGDKISADARIIQSADLRTNEASLTGESALVEKNNKVSKTRRSLGERHNMLYRGTLVVSGEAKAVIVATGVDTEFGKIAESISGVEDMPSPFQFKMLILSRWLIRVVLSAAVLILLIGLVQGFDFFEMLFVSVSVVVAAIPEGLPAVITIVLTIGVHRMSRRKALMRRLSAVEAIGSISTIASDKTGTLTYGQMVVTDLYVTSTYQLTGSGYDPQGNLEFNGKKVERIDPSIIKFLTYGYLCSDARVYKDDDTWKVDGDPTEAALVVAGQKLGISKNELDRQYPRIDVIPFSTERHYMATLHQDNSRRFIAVKGTIEKILDKSKYYLSGHKPVKLTPQARAEILLTNRKFTEKGLRVLAIATAETRAVKLKERDIDQLVFVGLVGMLDAPRKEATLAINQARKAGIDVIMLTGDHRLTAKAIADRLGLTKSDDEVLDGDALSHMSAQELAIKLEHVKVFARISPQDKLRIVQLLQENGKTVAVTGDGVNDAPALKQADIGIAMGSVGTDVAREASEMVLSDDNFSTIIAAIEEGRTVVDNIKKTVAYMLATNAAELGLIVLALVVGLPVPLNPLQILWINLITDGTNNTALALDPKTGHTLTEPPKRKGEFFTTGEIRQVITMAVLMTLGTIAVYIWALNQGHDIEYARTVSFVSMVFFQIFNIWNCRSLSLSVVRSRFLSNPYIILSAGLSLGLLGFAVYTELGQNILDTVALPANEMSVLALVGLSIIVAMEFYKSFYRSAHGRNY
jgi:Ca2+-transporting ATPase